jgi:hypothetical protein
MFCLKIPLAGLRFTNNVPMPFWIEGMDIRCFAPLISISIVAHNLRTRDSGNSVRTEDAKSFFSKYLDQLLDQELMVCGVASEGHGL